MKAITPQHLRDEGTQFILSNTYHLMLTPGPDVIANMGGLQRFTAWNGNLDNTLLIILSNILHNF